MQEITTSKALTEAALEIEKYKVIALDTEFVRHKTFFPKLCLAQIKAGNEIYLIDVMTIENCSKFYDILTNPGIIKLMHSAASDIEVVHHESNKVIKPIFDTQIAASFLNMGDSISYEALVREIIGKEIDKSLQFTDWSQRPLSTAHINYAACDVLYLEDIYKILKAKLAENGRLEWMMEDIAKLYKYQPDNGDEIWLKIAPTGKTNRFLTNLKYLTMWREKVVRKLNKPRNHFINKDQMLTLAKKMPSNKYELKKLIPTKSDKFYEELAAMIKEIQLIPAEPLKEEIAQHQNSWRMLNGDLVHKISGKIEEEAKKIGISAQLIAPKKEIKQLVIKYQARKDLSDCMLMKGWRGELIGKYLFQEGYL